MVLPPFAPTSCFLKRKDESLHEFWLKTEDTEGPAAVGRSETQPGCLVRPRASLLPAADAPQFQGSGALLPCGGSF